MTTEPLPADSAIERALELAGLPKSFLTDVKLATSDWRSIIAHARTLEKYEPAPVDPLEAEAKRMMYDWRKGVYETTIDLTLACLKRGIEIERERGKP